MNYKTVEAEARKIIESLPEFDENNGNKKIAVTKLTDAILHHSEEIIYLVKGYKVYEDGKAVPFSELCNFSEAHGFFRLSLYRNSPFLSVKVDSIEVIWCR